MKKHFLTLIVFFILPFLSFPQEIQWQNTIGGSGIDELHSIQQTSDGGYILGGWSGSNISGDKTENSQGGWDYWIIKTDSLGVIQWQKTIGGNNHDWLYSLEQTTDGGYILGGYSRSNISGDKTEDRVGFDDYWIVKTDSLGAIQWQNTIGGSSIDELHSIRQTNDGGYILGGSSKSNISGDKTENSQGGWDYWIVKTDSFGVIQWQNTIGGIGIDELRALQQTSDGGYILGGWSSSNISGDKTENSNGDYDYWLVKTDSLGVIHWQNTIGGGYLDNLLFIEQTTDRGYILGGWSYSNATGDKTEKCQGGRDYWIVKTDSLGIIQWQNTIGGSGDDVLNSIQQTTDGGYILGGYSYSNISGDKTENSQGFEDYWIVKTDSLGVIGWQNTIGGSNSDHLYSLQQTTNGGYILGGCSYSNISGDKTESNQGSSDYWIVKLTSNFNTITGTVYGDLNSDSMPDVGEPVLANKKITELTTGRFSFSEQNGKYSVAVLDSGNYVVGTDPLNNFNTVPLNHNAYFSSLVQTDSLNDFGFQPMGIVSDLCVTITPLGNFRSGFNASYMINYGNYGSTNLSPTLLFFPYNNVTYSSATVTPSSVTSDSVMWNLPALAPLQTGNMVVTVLVDVGLPIGTVINSSVGIEPVAGNANPACNNHAWEVLITGSFDPNDIIVNEDTLTTTQLAASPWLEYTIRFQNTGNDTAFTVKILNSIDTNRLELSSLEYVNASHPVHLNWIPWERNLEFLFENILLPDTNINEPHSHGFVTYRIRPKTTVSSGDSITNTAGIYFDFNSPVITNTAVTKIILLTGINEYSGNPPQLVLYPNPSTDEITISGYTLTKGKAEIKVLDVLGSEVYTGTATTENFKIPAKNLARGVYLVLCGGSYARLVKQ